VIRARCSTLCRSSVLLQIHIAGYTRESPELVIDTQAPQWTRPCGRCWRTPWPRTGAVPVLLERDHHFPPLPELLREIDHIRAIGAAVLGREAHASRGDADA
jgi:uncharacterized protein (UPF0276 family)